MVQYNYDYAPFWFAVLWATILALLPRCLAKAKHVLVDRHTAAKIVRRRIKQEAGEARKERRALTQGPKAALRGGNKLEGADAADFVPSANGAAGEGSARATGDSRATREDIERELSRAQLRAVRGSNAFSTSEHSAHLLHSTRGLAVSAKRDGSSVAENSFDATLSLSQKSRKGTASEKRAKYAARAEPGAAPVLAPIAGSPRASPR